MNQFNFEFAWVPLQTANGAYSFPQGVTAFIRELYSDAALYRWVILEKDGTVRAMYYGECANLANRLQGYLRPSAGSPNSRGQMTNLRLKQRFDQELVEGRNVVLERIQFRPFRINGVEFSNASLSNAPIRKALENIFIAAHNQQCELLNRTCRSELLLLGNAPSSGVTEVNSGMKRQGVIDTIIEALIHARDAKAPLTSGELVSVLAERFPDRSRAGMSITVRAQLSRLPRERNFRIAKIREGRLVRYSAE